MTFKEVLPQQCPPEEATDGALLEAYRLVYSNPPQAKDFYSKKAMGLTMPEDGNECGFASCSLNAKPTQAIRLALLPKPREAGAMVAKLSIPSGSGKWTQNRKKHIHFWMYAEFDPCTAFVEMVQI